MIWRRIPMPGVVASLAVAAGFLLLDLPALHNARIEGFRESMLTPPGDMLGVSVGGAARAALNPTEAMLENFTFDPPGVDTTARGPYGKALRIEKGDTLMGVLTDAEIPPAEAHAAIVALRKAYDPRNLKPGHEIIVSFEPDANDPDNDRFVGLSWTPDIERSITVTRADSGAFKATKIEKPVALQVARAQGTIRSSLYEAAVEAKLPIPLLMEMVKNFSWDVDFQRDIQPGDGFEIMFERYVVEGGDVAREGAILHATLILSGERKAIYRFTAPDGHTDYYDDRGRGVRKALLRTPIDGARLSSGFGLRTHPILGFTKMHRGVDFAAPPGTPIYAAGEGSIEVVGHEGGYGNYVRIRHTSDYATAYAHMSKFGPGIKRGKKVKQGQVIGYVGSTGRSTGPHLHYEILLRGSQTNPLSVKMPPRSELAGKSLDQFKHHKAGLDRQLAGLPITLKVATKE